jgi:nicotinamide-nucleotide amidase
MFKIALISIGDEICIGQIVNTNASWIAAKCTGLGAEVFTHAVIRDDKNNLINELNRLIPLSELIIITGGLGPTHDDITKNVLCEYFNDDLILHESTLEYLDEIFQLRGFKLTERNKEQALAPSKSQVLSNSVGTAPGMLFEFNGKFIVSLPGVPAEMKYIMNNSVLPFFQRKIAERNDNVVLYKNLNTTGIAESKLADLIGEPKDFLNGGTLAFLPSYRGVKLRIGVTADNFQKGKLKLEEIENIILHKAGKYIFGIEDDSLVSSVGSLLTNANKTVSVAESCTGGLLGAEFTSVSGSSTYFKGGIITYSNEAKEKLLNVNSKILTDCGAVSEQVASEMASNVRILFNTNYGIGITGIAGPTGGSEEKPVGTVFIGLADEKSVSVKKFVFSNDREINRERAVGTALTMLLDKLNKRTL